MLTQELGFSNMTSVYSTDSVAFRGEMEKALIDFYGARCDNVNEGGGGGAGEAPFIVYVVW